MFYKHLDEKDRFYIQTRLENNDSYKKIANDLKVSHTTIGREVKRNINTDNIYESASAHSKSVDRRSGSYKPISEKITEKVKDLIKNKLLVRSSPEVISGELLLNDGIKIGKNTIYAYIKEDKKNNGNLYKLLPHRGKAYKIKSDACLSKIPNRTSISERPIEANLKKNLGHYEMDTMVGKDNASYLLTLGDKTSKQTIMRKMLDKKAETVVNTIREIVKETKVKFNTITTDNGTEFSQHEKITEITGAKVYFTDPYSSYQKGLIEHINGQIRIFFPKGTDFRKLSNDDISYVENILNNRGRKSLGFKSPNQVKLE